MSQAKPMAQIDSVVASKTASVQNQIVNDASQPEVLDLRVVVLINYVRKHHVAGFEALARRVRELTVLLSTPMEPDREWDPEWAGLDVRVQKNWMFTTKWKHSSGFRENNFIHIPIDTVSQLKSLKPDVVLSYEMGMRTLLSGWFRRFHRQAPLVMVGNMSDRIERERGVLRRCVRRCVCRLADYFTYNGPSCRRYLNSLGIPDDRLFHVPYCIDQDVVFKGQRLPIEATRPRRLLYCGALSERKGVMPFAAKLADWCQRNPAQSIEFQLAGSGPLQGALNELAAPNLNMNFLGQLDVDQLRAVYSQADLSVMPTLADEWGLTTIESLASGVPVLGSQYAQSVEAVVENGVNGWIFRPDEPETVELALQRALTKSPAELDSLVPVCRESVAHISAEATADKFCDLIQAILPSQHRQEQRR